METTKTFTSLLFIILIINACSKGCPEGDKPFDKGVDKSYLPYIIPYSDTSTRLFLKNGKDTLLFKSQGLKETFTVEGVPEICDKYKLQQYSLKMAASDTDFFEVSFFAKVNSTLNYGKYNFNDQFMSKEIFDGALVLYYPPVIKINILNSVYDTVNVVSLKPNGNIYSKKYIGIIKIETSNSIYELIK